jgi:hypothetical protein
LSDLRACTTQSAIYEEYYYLELWKRLKKTLNKKTKQSGIIIESGSNVKNSLNDDVNHTLVKLKTKYNILDVINGFFPNNQSGIFSLKKAISSAF